MKFCQLQFRFLGLLLFMFISSILTAQRTVSPTLESYFGNNNVDYCIGEPLHLFIFGDYPPNDTRVTDYDYEIFRERGGVVQTLQYRSSTFSMTIPSSEVQHGDIYYGRAYSYTPTPVSEETNRITINAVAPTLSLTVSSTTGILRSSLPNNRACPGESFDIYTLGEGMEYTFFYPSGVAIAPRSQINSHTITGITTSTRFLVEAHISAVCEVTMFLDIDLVNLVPGSISGTQTICRGVTPTAIQNTTDGAVNGIAVLPTDPNFYQWEASEDLVQWSVLSGVHTATYQPQSLVRTTWFRRGILDSSISTSCIQYSNVVTVTVTPPMEGP